MAVDRTSELLEHLESATAPKTDVHAERAGLRSRHRRDRFAVEDQRSSILGPGDSPDKSAHPHPHPPRHSFTAEASGVYSNIVEAERILAACQSSSAPLEAPFQEILDLCLMRISTLQKTAERLAAGILFGTTLMTLMGWIERRSSQGWLAVFRGSVASQLDQHEAAIVWFLNHRFSSLSQGAESYREQLERRAKESLRVKESHKYAMASARPTLDQGGTPAAGYPVPVLSNEYLAEEFGVSPQQMQALAMENDSLLKEYGEMKQQIDTTHASINEIARLQTTLQEQLTYQAAQIDRLFDETSTTVNTIQRANTHLTQASKKRSGSVTFFLWFMVMATLFVLLLHIISD